MLGCTDMKPCFQEVSSWFTKHRWIICFDSEIYIWGALLKWLQMYRYGIYTISLARLFSCFKSTHNWMNNSIFTILTSTHTCIKVTQKCINSGPDMDACINLYATLPLSTKELMIFLSILSRRWEKYSIRNNLTENSFYVDSGKHNVFLIIMYTFLKIPNFCYYQFYTVFAHNWKICPGKNRVKKWYNFLNYTSQRKYA